MTREELNDGIQKEIIKEQKKETIKKAIKTTIKSLLIGTILAIFFFTYTTYISTALIKVQEYRIINEKIPSEMKGLKIIHFSDLHLGSSFDIDDMKKVRKLSNERKPDLVLFTGDLIYKDLEKEKQEDLIKELKMMKASIGKYAILGDEDNEKVATIFNQSEFTILRNEYDLIYKEKENPILLVGISSMLKNQQDLKKAYQYFELPTHNSNIYTISMFHEPDLTNDIINSNQTDLLLSGHSHNGQIRIPFLNKGIIHVEGAKKYNNPHYNIEDKELFISSGLGTKTGFRLFCRPSINFYRLSNS